MLTQNDIDLIQKAKSVVGLREVRAGGSIKEAGSALVTKRGLIFTGASLDLACGIGFCAEHSAIAAMVSQTDETQIKTIVAVDKEKVLPPCGRCRELIGILNKKNFDTEVILNDNDKITLKELLPHPWEAK